MVVQNVQGNLLLRTIPVNHGYSNRCDDNEQITGADDNVQGNLLQNYEQKIANPPEHLQLIKLCSNVGITKTVARRQYFTNLDKLGGSCREFSLPRDNAASKVKRMDP